MHIHVNVSVSYLCKSVGYLPQLVSRADHDRILCTAHSSSPLCYAYTHIVHESYQSQKSLINHSVQKMSQQVFTLILLKMHRLSC